MVKKKSSDSKENFFEDNKDLANIKEQKVKSITNEEEPSWYHYLIVIGIIGLIFTGIYFAYYIFYEEPVLENPNNQTVLVKYPYVVGNITYNLYFENSLEDLESSEITQELTRLDLLNTNKFIMSFMEYNGTDNGQVSKGSTKLVSFLRLVYNFRFDENSFVMDDQINCSSSTLETKVILFNPYSDKEGIYFNKTNGCIQLLTNNATHMIDLVDLLIYDVTIREN